MYSKYTIHGRAAPPKNPIAKRLADPEFRPRQVPTKLNKEKLSRRKGYLRRQLNSGVDALSGGWLLPLYVPAPCRARHCHIQRQEFQWPHRLIW